METVLSGVVGVLFGTGVYLMLRRNLLKLVIGVALVANAVNLLIFTAAGPVREEPPVIPMGLDRLEGPVADPLPQALILTAIVIALGITAFLIVLVYRTDKAMGSDDPDAAQSTEAQPERRPELTGEAHTRPADGEAGAKEAGP